MLEKRFNKGFFVPTKKHIYTKFDSFEPLALLHLVEVMQSKSSLVPQPWPSVPLFGGFPYRYKIWGMDYYVIYQLTEEPVLPISLQEAAAIGDVDLIKKLIANGARVEFIDNTTYMTALHRAAMEGQKAAAELLLTEGAPVNERDEELRTPLDYAIEERHEDVIEVLLVNGADVNVKDGNGRTAWDRIRLTLRGQSEILESLKSKIKVSSIYLAAQFGNLEKAKEFLEEGIDINAKDENGQTALFIAVNNDNKEIVQLLIDKGADVNDKNDDGQTPFDIILKRNSYQVSRSPNHVEIRDMLLANGAEIMSIHAAVKSGDIEKIREFLEHGTDINSKNENGETPLHIAVDRDSNDIAKLLIDKGANINAIGGRYDNPVLTYAIWNSNKDLVSLLVSKGAEVNFSAQEGDSILYEAIWMDDFDIVKILVDNGAKYDVKDKDGLTALYQAISQGSMDIVKLFLSKGIDTSSIHMAACAGDLTKVKEFIDKGTSIDVNDEAGWTALVWAVNAGQIEIAEFLIDNNADINVKYGRQNQSLLHGAVQSDSVELIELLIAKGIDVNIKNRIEQTPLYAAVSIGHVDAVKFLLDKGADVNVSLGARGRGARGGMSSMTLLNIAQQRGYDEIVELLKKHGAKE